MQFHIKLEIAKKYNRVIQYDFFLFFIQFEKYHGEEAIKKVGGAGNLRNF